MIVDNKLLTVTLRASEGISNDQLRGLIAIGMIGGEWTFIILPDEAPEVPPVTIDWFKYVASDQKAGVSYLVARLSNGDWVCSCPDWIHRKSETSGACKHICRVYWGY